jgi:N-acetylneuraminate 9-O-acetyltransferase
MTDNGWTLNSKTGNLKVRAQFKFVDVRISMLLYPGCMLHSYKQEDLAPCVDKETWVFIGDSVTRKLYYQTANAMDSSLPSAAPNSTEKHSDHTLKTHDGSELLFFWDPFLNSSRVADYIGLVHPARQEGTSPRASILILGSGLWYLRYASSGGLPAWEARMDAILGTIASAKYDGTQEVVVLPVEDLIPSKLSQARAATMHNSDIDAMNSDLVHPVSVTRQSSKADVYLPTAFNLLLDPSQTNDGLHFFDSIVKAQVNILFNYRCNRLLQPRYPYDTTCCRPYPPRRATHLFTLFILFVGGPIFWLLCRPLGAFFPCLRTSWGLTSFLQTIQLFSLLRLSLLSPSVWRRR